MFNQIRFLPKERIDAHVACFKTDNLDQFHLPNIHSLDETSKIRHLANRIARKINPGFRINYLSPVVRSLNPNIVHSHFGHIGAIDSKRLTSKAVKHVVTFYGVDVSKTPKINPSIYEEYQQLFKKVDRVLCEGPFMAQKVVELGCSEHKVRVQHLGVDLEGLDYRPREWSGNDTLRVLMAATFREKKGLPYAIRALGMLRDIDVQLTIIGDANKSEADQLEKQNILRALEESGLAEKTNLLGYLSHGKMIELAYQNHLFMSTSVEAADGDSEGGAPVTLIEMAATGIPIISSTHCDIPSIVLDRETGWLAPERDIPGILNCLEEFVGSKGSMRSMLDHGRAHIEKEFSATVQGERLANHYAEVANSNAKVN